MSSVSNVRTLSRQPEQVTEANKQGLLQRWFTPRAEVQVVEQQTSRGVFLPWPLLGIIATVAIVLISGIITLAVQVTDLKTTILLRDADTRAEMAAVKEKEAQLEVYIHNDREKLIDIQTTLRESEKRNNDARRH